LHLFTAKLERELLSILQTVLLKIVPEVYISLRDLAEAFDKRKHTALPDSTDRLVSSKVCLFALAMFLTFLPKAREQ